MRISDHSWVMVCLTQAGQTLPDPCSGSPCWELPTPVGKARDEQGSGFQFNPWMPLPLSTPDNVGQGEHGEGLLRKHGPACFLPRDSAFCRALVPRGDQGVGKVQTLRCFPSPESPGHLKWPRTVRNRLGKHSVTPGSCHPQATPATGEFPSRFAGGFGAAAQSPSL